MWNWWLIWNTYSKNRGLTNFLFYLISIIGHAEYELGKLGEAVSTFKKGLEYEPGNAILKERLTKVEEELKEEGNYL